MQLLAPLLGTTTQLQRVLMWGAEGHQAVSRVVDAGVVGDVFMLPFFVEKPASHVMLPISCVSDCRGRQDADVAILGRSGVKKYVSPWKHFCE